MTREDRAALRLAVIAGPTDCVMDPPEAAAFLTVSESWLRSSDVPRADAAGTKYLKSQLILYVKLRLSHQLLAS